MADNDRDELVQRQAALWEEVLGYHGIPPHALGVTRRLAERITAAIDNIPEHEIEMLYGFGDYTRGLASVAAIEAVAWVGTPSA